MAFVKEAVLFAAALVLIVGCDTDRAIPIRYIEAPVAFVAHPGAGRVISASEQELMVLDAATGRVWQLTSDWANDGQPSWSPSGSHLLFISGRPKGFEPPVPPWPSSSGVDRLFIYDLNDGRIDPVDLSWAHASGPASPEDSEQGIGTLGWLECADWSPLDSTQIAIGVTIGLSEQPSLTRRKRRLVLVDLEEQTARMIAEYDELCSGLLWSPDGRYLATQGLDSFDYVEVGTGKTHRVQGSHVVDDDSVNNYVAVDWGLKPASLLVRGYSFGPSDTHVYYRYNVRQKTWSDRLDQLEWPDRIVGYSPFDPRTTQEDSLGRIILRALGKQNTYQTDLWLHRRPKDTDFRLTDDQTLKFGVRSFHGQK
jgi:hypothetical protein